MSVVFWLNVVSMKRGDGGDNERGLDDIEMLVITVFGIRSLVVSKLIHWLHSACEELGKISCVGTRRSYYWW